MGARRGKSVLFPVHDLDRNFSYHKPTDGKIVRHQILREAGKELARVVTAKTAPGREQSLALTKIEEAIFWANASVARELEEQENA